MVRLFLASLCVVSLVWAGCSDDEDSENPSSAGSSLSSSMASLSSVFSGASSAVSSLSSSAAPVSLFISEYVEGSGSNKYIELYNPTTVPITLSGWTLRQYNGGATPTAAYILALSGSVEAGYTFVIKRALADKWSGTAQLSDNGVTMDYNGNDAVGLFNGDTLVDIVGTPGNSTDHIKDMTLVRKPGTSAATTWSADDWYQLPPDTVANLGSHDPVNPMSSSSASSALPVEYPLGTAGNDVYISEYFQGDGNDKYIEIFNGGTARVSLAGYRLVRIDADNTTGVTNLANSWCLALVGELEPYFALLIVNGGYSPDRLTTVAGVPTASAMDEYSTARKYLESVSFYPKAICFFGGNDPIYLVKDGQVVDAVGTPATNLSWGDKRAFVRKTGKSANPVWSIDDWDIIETMTPAPGSVYNDGSDQNAGWHIQ